MSTLDFEFFLKNKLFLNILLLICLVFFSESTVFSETSICSGISGIIRVSISSQGVEGNQDSVLADFSPDGRFVVFLSNADNLVSNDRNNKRDLFLHDIKTRTTTRLSLSSTGGETNDDSDNGAISSNNRYVTFSSAASNLVGDDTNTKQDVFLRDIEAGTTTLVSVMPDGTQGNHDSMGPTISHDGRYIAFYSSASNFTGKNSIGQDIDYNNSTDIFLKDMNTGALSLISVDPSGYAGSRSSNWPVISGDGRYVDFNSYSSNLVSGDINGMIDAFRSDTQTKLITLTSVSSLMVQGNRTSQVGSTPRSANGRYVSFFSSSSNLVDNDTNNTSDIFVRDTVENTTTVISVNSSGLLGNWSSFRPSISADGRFVAFYTAATNLVAETDKNIAKTDIIVRDTKTGKNVRVNLNTQGEQGNKDSYNPTISDNGVYVAFTSVATNLVANDQNNAQDVFVTRNSAYQCPVCISSPENMLPCCCP